MSFSGLTPKILSWYAEDWSVNDRAMAAVAKFDTAHTVTDFFGICQTALTTENSTTHLRLVIQDGGTTGSGTGAIVVINGAWVAFTARTSATNYTLAANEYLRIGFSEAGTVDAGSTVACVWVVQGNI